MNPAAPAMSTVLGMDVVVRAIGWRLFLMARCVRLASVLNPLLSSWCCKHDGTYGGTEISVDSRDS